MNARYRTTSGSTYHATEHSLNPQLWGATQENVSWCPAVGLDEVRTSRTDNRQL